MILGLRESFSRKHYVIQTCFSSDTSILNNTVFTDGSERDLTVSGEDFVLKPGKNTVQLENKVCSYESCEMFKGFFVLNFSLVELFFKKGLLVE